MKDLRLGKAAGKILERFDLNNVMRVWESLLRERRVTMLWGKGEWIFDAVNSDH